MEQRESEVCTNLLYIFLLLLLTPIQFIDYGSSEDNQGLDDKDDDTNEDDEDEGDEDGKDDDEDDDEDGNDEGFEHGQDHRSKDKDEDSEGEGSFEDSEDHRPVYDKDDDNGLDRSSEDDDDEDDSNVNAAGWNGSQLGESNRTWPPHTNLCVTNKGVVNINNKKNRGVKPILKLAIRTVNAACLFKNTYPEYPDKLPYLKKLLLQCASHHGDPTITERLRQDYDYFLLMKTVVGVISPFPNPILTLYQARKQTD